MFIVEGNIGTGKSTLLALLHRDIPEATIAMEPVHNWQDELHGQSLLANFYNDPQRWAYTLETYAMTCRVREHLQEQKRNSLVIMERSLYSGYYCFAKNSYIQGFLSDIEWHMHSNWFNFLVSNNCTPPQGFIYLTIDPVVAFERIHKRNRPAEKSITLNYLEQIHQRHHDFLINKKDLDARLAAIPVLMLDCNEEFENNPERYRTMLTAVRTFIEKNK